MKKNLLFLFFGLLGSHCCSQAYGNFPYFQPFNSGSRPTEIVASGHTSFNSNGLQLTSAVRDQFGAAYVNSLSFGSDVGIDIEFEYDFYGGSMQYNRYGDGLAMFLFDSKKNTSIGSNGSGLGYSYNRSNKRNFSNKRKRGIIGAYLGIGFDLFGNFHKQRYQGESRRNGMVNTSGSDMITLRGAEGLVSKVNNTNYVSGYGDGFFGYPVLITRSTSGSQSAILNPHTGSYSNSSGLSSFSLRGDTLKPTPGKAGYRKAFINIRPHSSGGFNITVKIQHENTITTVINNYHYPLQVTYVENANSWDNDAYIGGSSPSGSNSTHTLNTTPPQYFKIGFSASTGATSQIHLLRNLRITLPYAATAGDDSTTICGGNNATISILTNDKIYTGTTVNPVEVTDPPVDAIHFNFCDNSGNSLGNSHHSSQGIWAYDSSTGKVTFTPDAGFTGTATIKYYIQAKSGDFSNDSGYRSTPATITVTIHASPGIPVINCNSSTVTNYDSSVGYTFNPKGPVINSSGVITGLNSNTAYTLTATKNSCSASTSFTCTYACYKNPVTTGTTLDTNQGISSLQRIAGSGGDHWPIVRKGGHLALESQTKGFVINRLTTNQKNTLQATHLIKGMVVYDTNLHCLNIYDGSDWKCFLTPACPD